MDKKTQELNYVEKFSSIREMVKTAADEDGEKKAYAYRIKDKITEITFKEFYSETSYLGTALLNMGITKDHINVVGENRYEYIVVYLTSLMSDGVFVPVDKELPFEDMANIINDCDSSIIFYSKKYEKAFKENLEKIYEPNGIILQNAREEYMKRNRKDI